jgi:transcription initiation factor IIE alpha subunit
MRETNGQIQDLPPSAKLVLKVLENNAELTQKQIVEETRLSQRTVRDALSRLIESGIVEKMLYVPDGRQNLYTITAPMHSEPAESSKV